MANLRRPRYLSCFYCGKRSSLRYDGRIRNFACLHCEAVNYLDENGEITDPPVATTEAEPLPVQYAIPRTSSPQSSPSSAAIFCDTCLKNQHLFTASLAQYLPDDPNHPEHEGLDGKYYKFRKGLEQRYPQVCAECEPRVLDRINQAGYTAKTDHLRRMIDKSRDNRHLPEKSPLGWLNYLGRRLRQAGLALQLLWHLVALYAIYVNQLPATDEDTVLRRFLPILGAIFGTLPSPDKTIRWSFMATVASCWWNPKFVQSIRGFTRPIIGLPNWYMYQAMLVFLRMLFPQLVGHSSKQASQLSTQLGAHMFMALFTVYIYQLAGKAVRIDTSPLFGPKLEGSLTPRSDASPPPQKPGNRNMSEILDEILATPAANLEAESRSINRRDDPTAHRDALGTSLSSSFRPPTTRLPGTANGAWSRGAKPESRLGAMSLSDEIPRPSTPPSVQQIDEMDWSPTQSAHRAFSSYSSTQNKNKGFGETPTEPHAGPFWYKVPPAPTNPAQRLFNAPNPPRLRQSPVTKEEVTFGKNGSQDGLEKTEKKPDVAFAPASFFVAANGNDPRNSLSDLFGKSFSLTPSQEQEEESRRRGERPASPSVVSSPRLHARAAEIGILFVLLQAWLYVISTQHGYAQHVLLGTLCICIVISTRATGDALGRIKDTKSLAFIPAIRTLLGGTELAFACQLSFQVMASEGQFEAFTNQGVALIGTMIGHQFWNALQ